MEAVFDLEAAFKECKLNNRLFCKPIRQTKSQYSWEYKNFWVSHFAAN